MRTILLLLLLFPIVSTAQDAAPPQQDSTITILSHKWTKTRQLIAKTEFATLGTAPALIPQGRANTERERQRRLQLPPGTRDPIEDTVEGRSAALEKIAQESRSHTTKPIDGYAYKAKIKNASTRVIEVVFWEYRFTETADRSSVARRQFLCGVNIKPDKEKELQAFSLSGPSDVISVGSLSNKSGTLYDEKIIINRLEYSDGTIWQRKDWNFSEVRMGITRALGTPWGAEMCRGI